MKGIILAGGSGSRLYPLTLVTSKQLLPIYDKPMIYYPLSTLMLAGIRDILIISTPEDTPRFVSLLKDGKQLGLNLSYAVQQAPNGLAEAFIIGEKFIGNDACCLVLGDNIFYGNGFKKALTNAAENANKGKATIFGYFVNDPERFGVVEFDDNKKPIGIVEKPKNPKSNYAVVGLYFYPKGVSKHAKEIKPSKRGELEITTLNNIYLDKNQLELHLFGRGFTWLDTGTHESLADATSFVQSIEEHQGLKVSCVEEIAYNNGWISKDELIKIGESMKNNKYGEHLLNVAHGKIAY